ncbi:MAG: hypothetical protein EZS28_024934, partial [Streblomastix strix]
MVKAEVEDEAAIEKRKQEEKEKQILEENVKLKMAQYNEDNVNDDFGDDEIEEESDEDKDNSESIEIMKGKESDSEDGSSYSQKQLSLLLNPKWGDQNEVDGFGDEEVGSNSDFENLNKYQKNQQEKFCKYSDSESKDKSSVWSVMDQQISEPKLKNIESSVQIESETSSDDQKKEKQKIGSVNIFGGGIPFNRNFSTLRTQKLRKSARNKDKQQEKTNQIQKQGSQNIIQILIKERFSRNILPKQDARNQFKALKILIQKFSSFNQILRGLGPRSSFILSGSNSQMNRKKRFEDAYQFLEKHVNARIQDEDRVKVKAYDYMHNSEDRNMPFGQGFKLKGNFASSNFGSGIQDSNKNIGILKQGSFRRSVNMQKPLLSQGLTTFRSGHQSSVKDFAKQIQKQQTEDSRNQNVSLMHIQSSTAFLTQNQIQHLFNELNDSKQSFQGHQIPAINTSLTQMFLTLRHFTHSSLGSDPDIYAWLLLAASNEQEVKSSTSKLYCEFGALTLKVVNKMRFIFNDPWKMLSLAPSLAQLALIDINQMLTEQLRQTLSPIGSQYPMLNISHGLKYGNEVTEASNTSLCSQQLMNNTSDYSYLSQNWAIKNGIHKWGLRLDKLIIPKSLDIEKHLNIIKKKREDLKKLSIRVVHPRIIPSKKASFFGSSDQTEEDSLADAIGNPHLFSKSTHPLDISLTPTFIVTSRSLAVFPWELIFNCKSGAIRALSLIEVAESYGQAVFIDEVKQKDGTLKYPKTGPADLEPYSDQQIFAAPTETLDEADIEVQKRKLLQSSSQPQFARNNLMERIESDKQIIQQHQSSEVPLIVLQKQSDTINDNHNFQAPFSPEKILLNSQANIQSRDDEINQASQQKPTPLTQSTNIQENPAISQIRRVKSTYQPTILARELIQTANKKPKSIKDHEELLNKSRVVLSIGGVFLYSLSDIVESQHQKFQQFLFLQVQRNQNNNQDGNQQHTSQSQIQTSESIQPTASTNKVKAIQLRQRPVLQPMMLLSPYVQIPLTDQSIKTLFVASLTYGLNILRSLNETPASTHFRHSRPFLQAILPFSIPPLVQTKMNLDGQRIYTGPPIKRTHTNHLLNKLQSLENSDLSQKNEFIDPTSKLNIKSGFCPSNGTNKLIPSQWTENELQMSIWLRNPVIRQAKGTLKKQTMRDSKKQEEDADDCIIDYMFLPHGSLIPLLAKTVASFNYVASRSSQIRPRDPILLVNGHNLSGHMVTEELPILAFIKGQLQLQLMTEFRIDSNSDSRNLRDFNQNQTVNPLIKVKSETWSSGESSKLLQTSTETAVQSYRQKIFSLTQNIIQNTPENVKQQTTLQHNIVQLSSKQKTEQQIPESAKPNTQQTTNQTYNNKHASVQLIPSSQIELTSEIKTEASKVVLSIVNDAQDIKNEGSMLPMNITKLNVGKDSVTVAEDLEDLTPKLLRIITLPQSLPPH